VKREHTKELLIWALIVVLSATFSFAQWKVKQLVREQREILERDPGSLVRLSNWEKTTPNNWIDLRKMTEYLVDAIIQVESGGDAWREGAAGERGLMQIKKQTWREMTRRMYGRGVDFEYAYNPRINRMVGKAYLNHLQRFLYRHRKEWRADKRSLLLACYNAGPAQVLEARFDIRLLPRSTRGYIKRATALHDWYLAEDAPHVNRLLLAHRRTGNAG
jgi:soluble lytic murein transglycosylase-like protein